MKSIALLNAQNEDLLTVLTSKEYATQTGKPAKETDGRVVIVDKDGNFVIGTGCRVYPYDKGCSKYWTTGSTPNGTDWNVIYTFESVTLYKVPEVLGLVSDIDETNENGRKVNRNQGINYIDLFGIEK